MTAPIVISIGGITITIPAELQDIPAPALSLLLGRIDAMTTALETLTQEVEETKGVVESAIVFIQGLKDQLAQAGTDPVKLQELAAALDQQQQALAAAIAVNPQPEPPVEPPVDA